MKSSKAQRRKDAAVYREAASRALDGVAYIYLSRMDKFVDSLQPTGWFDHGSSTVSETQNLRCLGLLFMAAMVEAGDA